MSEQLFWTKRFTWLNAVMLALVVLCVFVLPVLPVQYTHYLYPPVFSGLLLAAAFNFSRFRKVAVITALTLTALLWIAILSDWALLKFVARALQFLFFMLLVHGLIIDISLQPKVTPSVMTDAITGYLLLGFALSLFVTMVAILVPGAYSYTTHTSNPEFEKVSESIYYTFITYSTAGYGDIIPVHPLAKSLAMLIGISGQLYIAIIIAMLVGKFASEKK